MMINYYHHYIIFLMQQVLRILQTYVNQYFHLLKLNFPSFSIILREFRKFKQFYFLSISLEKLKNPFYCIIITL